MKLTHFSEQTLPKQMGGGNKLPRVAFGKNGVITFNKEACRLMDLKAKMKVTLGQDPDNPENWYWFKDAGGFELRAGYKGQSAQFNHTELSKLFLGAVGRELSKTQNFKIAGQPTSVKGDKTQYWGILS